MTGATMYFSVEEGKSDDSGKAPDASAHQALEDLRAELDAVDATLLDAVGRRLEVCRRIGELKRRSDIAMMQPHRIGLVHERARRYADSHSLSPAFFDALYDLLIAETCRLEELVINGETGASGPGDSGHNGHHRPHPSTNVESS
nr:chorismate mutase family protein [Rhodococcus sp. USK13]